MASLTSTPILARDALALNMEAARIKADMLARFGRIPSACRPSPPPATRSTSDENADINDKLNIDGKLQEEQDVANDIAIDIDMDMGPSLCTPHTPPPCAQPILTASPHAVLTPDAARCVEPIHDDADGSGWAGQRGRGWDHIPEGWEYNGEVGEYDGHDLLSLQSSAYSFGVGPSSCASTYKPSPSLNVPISYGEFNSEEFEIALIQTTAPPINDGPRARLRRLRRTRDMAGLQACIRCRQNNIACVGGPNTRCLTCEKGRVACSRTWVMPQWETAVAVRGQLLLLSRLEAELRRREGEESQEDGAVITSDNESQTDPRIKTALTLLPRAGVAAARFLSLNFAPAMGLNPGDWYVHLFASAKQQWEQAV